MSKRTYDQPYHFQSMTPTGNSQATAAPIDVKASPGFVTATGDAVTGLILPPASKGKEYNIKNVGTTQLQILNLYPPVGGFINSQAVNTPIAMGPQTSAQFIADGSATWHSSPVVPS